MVSFFSSFAVKTPMWPVHTWLPDAHVEAPTAGSVLLAAILLKWQDMGLLDFHLGLFPIASENFTMLVYILSLIAIIYTSLYCFDAGRYEKTYSIFVCCTYGICNTRYLYNDNNKVLREVFFK